jgi:hypothetical protein
MKNKKKKKKKEKEKKRTPRSSALLGTKHVAGRRPQ